jgi:hypothetical protein
MTSSVTKSPHHYESIIQHKINNIDRTEVI